LPLTSRRATSRLSTSQSGLLYWSPPGDPPRHGAHRTPSHSGPSTSKRQVPPQAPFRSVVPVPSAVPTGACQIGESEVYPHREHSRDGHHTSPSIFRRAESARDRRSMFASSATRSAVDSFRSLSRSTIPAIS